MVGRTRRLAKGLRRLRRGKDEQPVRRALFVLWSFQDIGGLYEFVVGLALALRARGVTVSVAVMHDYPPNQYVQRLSDEGVRVVAPPAAAPAGPALHGARTVRRALHMRPLRREGGAGLYRYERAFLALARREVRRVRPDVVHVHGARLFPTRILAPLREAGHVVVYSEHNTVGEHPDGYRPGAPALLLHAHALTCDSETSRASLAALLPDWRPIDILDTFGGPGATVAPGPAREGFRIVCVGRLASDKGLDVLLEAVARLRDRVPAVRLTVAGEGPLRAALEEQAAGLGLGEAVEFTGFLTRPEVNAALARSAVFAMPSRSEGSPLALQEAMAAGLPIVASNVGGIPQLLEDGVSGLLVPPDDVEALAGALQRLAADAALRERLGAAAREAWVALGHTPDAAAGQVLAVYRKAAGRASRSGEPPHGLRGDLQDAALFAALAFGAVLPGALAERWAWLLAWLATRAGADTGGALPPPVAGTFRGSRRRLLQRDRVREYVERMNYFREWLPFLHGPRVRLERGEVLAAALAEGRGAVVWVGFSADRLVGANKALALAGYRAVQLSRPLHGYFRTKRWWCWLNRPQLDAENRYLAGRVLVADDNGPRGLLPLVRVLRSGGVVRVAFDHTSRRPLERPFLGGTILVAPGAVRLAASGGAALVPAFTTRRGKTLVTVLGEPIVAGPDVERAVDEYLAQMERYVREDPEWWTKVIRRVRVRRAPGAAAAG